MALDFARAADLFCGSEKELAMALNIDVGDLRRFVEAMGGERDIVARFPDGAAKIRSFAELGSEPGR